MHDSSLLSEFFDYRVNNAPLLFAEAGGNQTQCAYVQIVNDEILEGRDTFFLLLTSQSSSVVVNPQSAFAEISILDADVGKVWGSCDIVCREHGVWVPDSSQNILWIISSHTVNDQSISLTAIPQLSDSPTAAEGEGRAQWWSLPPSPGL